MGTNKGVFIGAHVPAELKQSLERLARAEHRTVSQEIEVILTEAVHGHQLPPGSIDRRRLGSSPHRRRGDPSVRRRRNDLIILAKRLVESSCLTANVPMIEREFTRDALFTALGNRWFSPE